MPQGIISDQGIATRSAIAKAFPKTCHRFCLWHIGDANRHLNQIKGSNIDFQHDYEYWVYSYTIEESELDG